MAYIPNMLWKIEALKKKSDPNFINSKSSILENITKIIYVIL